MRPTRHACWVPVILTLLGCDQFSRLTARTWHQKHDWKAEDYFQDPQVIGLCHAIEADDLAEIDRLVGVGADVNALGEGKMTPLLWAFPDNKPARFTRLLEHGADPNIVITGTFPPQGAGLRPGNSVTHMVCKTAFPGYFEAVFENGGDPNLVSSGRGLITETPIHKIIMWGGARKREQIGKLIDLGADLNYVSGMGVTPSMLAAGWGRQFDISLQLLEAGANPSVYKPRENSRLIHSLAHEKLNRGQGWTNKQHADFEKLVDWLEKRGDSLDAATQDVKRWMSWDLWNGEYRRKMAAEVAERKRREGQQPD